MKLHKFLIPVPIITLAFASVNLVACNESDVIEPIPAPEEIANYISDRTFSLMAFSVVKKIGTEDIFYGDFCYGTGWIIDDATPETEDDYVYHIATNWHVVNGFHDLKTQEYPGYDYVGTIYCYSDDSCSTDESHIIDSVNEYVWLNQTGYKEETEKETFEYQPYSQKYGIDLYEIDIDFNDINQTSSPLKNMPAGVKDKLDSLNQSEDPINTFVLSDDPNIINKKKYIGGYPFKEKGDVYGGRWEAHEVNSNLEYVRKGVYEHSVGSSNVIDISPQYKSKYNVGTKWMTGGASGSLLLTEDYEICGIYWGGWTTSSHKKFYPSFSLFNISNKNFLDKYIHQTI